jgi:hypothetical protein
MHHTTFEFVFADESIPIAIKNSANKNAKLKKMVLEMK